MATSSGSHDEDDIALIQAREEQSLPAPYGEKPTDTKRRNKFQQMTQRSERCKRIQVYVGACMLTTIVFGVVIAITWQACGAFEETITQLDIGNTNYSSMVKAFRPIADDVYATMNISANPCIDAYNWGCGNWLDRTELSDDISRITKSFSALERANLELLEQVIADEWPIVTPYFSSCAVGFELGNFSNTLQTPYELIYNCTQKVQVFERMAQLRTEYGFDISGFAFSFSPTVNVYEPSKRLAGFWQGDVTLPSPHYYDQSTSPIDIEAYKRYITSLFALSPNPIHADDARAVFNFETIMTLIMLTNDEANTKNELFTKHPWSKMKDLLPSELVAYVNALELMPADQKSEFSLGTPSFFVKFIDLLQTTTLPILKNMALYTLFKQAYPLMGSTYQQAAKELSLLVNGVKHKSNSNSRELACLYKVTNEMELLMGHYFVQKAGINAEYKQHVAELIAFHVEAFNERLQRNTWMDATTRIAAEAKLAEMRRQVCYPDDWSEVLDFEQRLGAPMRPNDFFNNTMRIRSLFDHKAFEQLGQPVDPDAWSFGALLYPLWEKSESPEIVNAFYSPNLNRITIPAGIARPPFLYSYTHRNAPLSAIYGGLGTVIGHEITHGFDNSGSAYGKDGALTNWWSPVAQTQFAIDTQCVATARSQIETQVEGLYVNGVQTLGENIADLGGVETALDAMLAKRASLSESERTNYDTALRTVFPDLTDTQLFFLFFIQNWCEKATDESVSALIESNPHAPGAARVRGTLSDMPRFATAFQCKAGDPYNPSDRCTVW